MGCPFRDQSPDGFCSHCIGRRPCIDDAYFYGESEDVNEVDPVSIAYDDKPNYLLGEF